MNPLCTLEKTSVPVTDLAVNGNRCAMSMGAVLSLRDYTMFFVEKWEADLGASISRIAFSGHGKILAVVCLDKAVRVVDTESSRIIQVLEGHMMIPRCVDVNHDGSLVVTGAFDQTIRVWEIGGTRRIFEHFDVYDIYSGVAFLKDEVTFVSGSHERHLDVWRIPAIETWPPTGHDDSALECIGGDMVARVHQMALSRCRTLLATVFSSSVTLHHVGDPFRELWSVDHPCAAVVALSFSDLLLAVGYADGSVNIIEIDTGHIATTLSAHQEQVNSVCFTPCGNLLFTASLDCTVRVWPIGV